MIKMGKKATITKASIFVIAIGIASWAFYSFLNETINRFLEFIGNLTGFDIFFDTLFQNFIVLLLVTIIVVLLGFGFKKSISKIING